MDKDTPDKQSRSRRKKGTTVRVRSLRNAGNQAEALLWEELKDRRLGGYKFVRQFPLGPYVADFLCRERKLVVELDGSQHAGRQSDRLRDTYMVNNGYSVLRFWSHEVATQRRSICETILAALNKQLTEGVAAPDMRYVKSAAKRGD